MRHLAALSTLATRWPTLRRLRPALRAAARRAGPAAPAPPDAPGGSDLETLREQVLEGGLDARRARALGHALEAAGRPLEAVEALTLANLLRRDAALERRLVRLRHRAFAALDRSLPAPQWPPPAPPPLVPLGELPAVAPEQLSAAALRSGILQHGCLLVRGLVPPARAARLRRGIDRAFEACDAWRAGRPLPDGGPWYDPLEAVIGGEEVRGWIRDGRGVLAADAPRVYFELVQTVRELRLHEHIAGFLGEPAAISAEKCTLRRVDQSPHQADWHQDGAFLGKGIRTVNAWIALSPCGREAPGLDVVPRRLPLLPTGEAGAHFDWAVSPATVTRELPDGAVQRPAFEAGDVLLFDHQCLHRTAVAPGMTKLRHAIECWFFAVSSYPEGSTPLVV